MGNTCGCVDQAEKDGEVKVQDNKLTQQNNHRTAQINNYRDSTLSKNNQYQNPNMENGSGGHPSLFATDDPYLLEL